MNCSANSSIAEYLFYSIATTRLYIGVVGLIDIYVSTIMINSTSREGIWSFIIMARFIMPDNCSSGYPADIYA